MCKYCEELIESEISKSNIRKAVKEWVKTYDQDFPSQRFAEFTGISGLYKEWKIPYNMTANQAGILLVNSGVNGVKTRKFYKELIKLNPKLANITTYYNDNSNKHDICYGAISKFCYNDIKFFAENSNKASQDFILKYNKKNKDKHMTLSYNAGIVIGWVPSPKTYKLIEKYLNK